MTDNSDMAETAITALATEPAARLAALLRALAEKEKEDG
tara:strand:+ start:3145 stop:3261 length:117 start_codon:yes stop_codon:yes gene_type:complete